MSSIIASTDRTLIVGLGSTGLSVARFLAARGKQILVVDERENPPLFAQLQKELPDIPALFGPFDSEQWPDVSQIVLSPGVPRAHPAIARAIAHKIPVIGDIELFVREARAPIVAITGSNGKTTVTTLVGEMARAAGINVRVGGNIGTPALDLLDEQCELYVLELSSFQLESTQKLSAKAACVLNVTADHMDRYSGMPAYMLAKQRIYFGAERAVVNRADPLTRPPLADTVRPISFGLSRPDLKDYGLIEEQGVTFLARGLRALMPVSDLKIKGTHNVENALAALAIAEAAGVDQSAALVALRQFAGLAHRCQWVAEINGIEFYNDSKATNVGAAIAALQGLAPSARRITLIAGGDGKGADFSTFGIAISKYVSTLVTIGTDGGAIAACCDDSVSIKPCKTLIEAVHTAFESASPGDIVLLSPACASFDMFENYEDRGRQFVNVVEGLKQ